MKKIQITQIILGSKRGLNRAEGPSEKHSKAGDLHAIFISSVPKSTARPHWLGESMKPVLAPVGLICTICCMSSPSDILISVGSDRIDKRTIDNRANLSIIDNRPSIMIIIELGPWQYYRATTGPLQGQCAIFIGLILPFLYYSRIPI